MSITQNIDKAGKDYDRIGRDVSKSVDRVAKDFDRVAKDLTSAGKDLTKDAKAAGDTALQTAKTPFYAVIGASDHAAKFALARVADLRTRVEHAPADLRTRAENLPGDVRTAAEQARDRANAQVGYVRPDAVRDTVKSAVGEVVDTAIKTVRRYEKRGQMVVADLRRSPGFTRVLKTAENAVDSVEDKLEDLISDAQGELTDARKATRSSAGQAKATVRKASTKRAAPAKARKAPAAKKATSTKATATKAPARKSAGTRKSSTASKSKA